MYFVFAIFLLHACIAHGLPDSPAQLLEEITECSSDSNGCGCCCNVEGWDERIERWESAMDNWEGALERWKIKSSSK